MKKKIQIKCKGADLLPFETLLQFQGELKSLNNRNLKRLKNQILTKGFIAPFFIWKKKDKNFILDGTQRDKALKSLNKDGYEIPLLPVVYIEADNKSDAREKLLSLSSQYGDWDPDELTTWLNDIDSEIKKDLRFLDREMDIHIDIEDYSDLDQEMEDLKGMKSFLIVLKIPIKYKEKLLDWIANGEAHTQTGLGKGLLKRCELL